jgi:hypothetical protein
MRRWAALLPVAALIASVPATTGPATAAHADTPDPARALKRQLRTDHGVRISETTRYSFGKNAKATGTGTRITGTLQLSPSGPVATDFTWRNLPRSAPYRVIRVGTTVYDGSSHHPGPVPDGKKWIHFPNNHRGSMARDLSQDASLQPIDVYDPSLLKSLLKHSTRKPIPGGFLYQGTLTYKTLSRVSKTTIINWASGRPIGEKSKGKVSWQLHTDRAGLPKRLTTTDLAGDGKNPPAKRSDTRYTTWGFPLVITAPPAHEVIDEADLLEYIHAQNTPIPMDEGNT